MNQVGSFSQATPTHNSKLLTTEQQILRMKLDMHNLITQETYAKLGIKARQLK